MKASKRTGNRMVVTGFFVPWPHLFHNKVVFITAKNIISYVLLGIDQAARKTPFK